MPSYVNLAPGDPAPLFVQRSSVGPQYRFHLAAGRYIVLCFFGSASDRQSRDAVDAALKHSAFFNDRRGAFWGVSVDPEDESKGRVKNQLPGYRFIWDLDGQVSRLYGSIQMDQGAANTNVAIRRFWMVLDPTLRVMKTIPFAAEGKDVAELLAYTDSLPPPNSFAGFEVHPPILILPNVFEAALCQKLIEIYEADGGRETGSMKDIDGKTVEVHDHRHKRRKDAIVTDPEMINVIHTRVRRRLIPEIAKVHQFAVTKIERNLIACYDSADEGHFGPHRDNTTKGTAHRRFAVSVNLNDGFEGGELSFPEYASPGIKLPVGCAAVFSCSLLHTVSKVTQGRRYAFLPFLYDDAAAVIREQNRGYRDEKNSAFASTGS